MTRRLLGAWTWAGAALLMATSACGSSDDDSGFSNTGATGGTGGTGGSAGAGTDGGAGQSGAAGSGGTAGAASGGAAGAAGMGGSAGMAGAAGSSTGGSAGASTGGMGGMAGSAGMGSGGMGGMGATCADPIGEPNESEAAAATLPGVSCGGAAKKATGILAGSSDTDWYKIAAAGALIGCSPSVKAAVDKSGVDVCVYASCTTGATSVLCTTGSSSSSNAGRSGCCGSQSVEMTASCAGVANTQAATLFVKLSEQGNACQSYELTYSY